MLFHKRIHSLSSSNQLLSVLLVAFMRFCLNDKITPVALVSPEMLECFSSELVMLVRGKTGVLMNIIRGRSRENK